MMLVLQVLLLAVLVGSLAGLAWLVGEVVRAAAQVGLGFDVAVALTVVGVAALLVGWLVL